MLVVTTNDIPGWEIQRVVGEVFGLTVRSRNAFSQLGAGFKSMFGGELQGMTKNLTESRNEVMSRMLEHARAKGANAVIGMRFDPRRWVRRGRSCAPTAPPWWRHRWTRAPGRRQPNSATGCPAARRPSRDRANRGNTLRRSRRFSQNAVT